MIKRLMMAAALVVSSACALATPQYVGPTEGNPGFKLNKGNTSLGYGYYVWNDVADPSRWTVAWSGRGAAINPVTWYGEIEFITNNSLVGATPLKFESNDDLDIDLTGAKGLEWEAITNNTGGWDGFTFTIDSTYETLQFSLGSNLFNNLDLVNTDPGVASTNIFIGEDKNSTNVLVGTWDGTSRLQQFEVHVPEPGTLALFGLGLAGLGLSRRKEK